MRTVRVTSLWPTLRSGAAAILSDADAPAKLQTPGRKSMDRRLAAAAGTGAVATLAYLVGRQARRRLSRADKVDDQTLADRVRRRLGQLVIHPGSIEVTANDGVVRLAGPVLAGEVDRLVRGVLTVRGVRGIDNRLEVHDAREDVPGLQEKGRRRPGSSLKSRWAPVKRLAAIGTWRRAITVDKAIHVEARVERVFDLWTSYEHFPEFMSSVHRVEPIADGRSRWKVEGPGGLPVHFDAVVTAFSANRRFAWKTVPGSVIKHSGVVRFEPEHGGTRVRVQLSYNLAPGTIGHLVAALAGADPDKRLDEDLRRMKTFIETGRHTSGAADAGR